MKDEGLSNHNLTRTEEEFSDNLVFETINVGSKSSFIHIKVFMVLQGRPF